MKPAEILIEAYHTLYDAKDAEGDFLRKRDIWNAILALNTAMTVLGIEVPVRYDDEGRP